MSKNYPEAFVPVKGVWGRRGATGIYLEAADAHWFDVLQNSPYSTTAASSSRNFGFKGEAESLYNTELVRTLCKDIAAEEDAGKAQQLVSLLRAVIQDDQDEIRMRMSFLAKKYAIVLNEPNSTE